MLLRCARSVSSFAIAGLCLIACKGDGKQAPALTTRPSATVIATRPYEVHAPPRHDGRAPLLVLLHGFGGDHVDVAEHFGVAALADEHGFYVALPDGTADPEGRRFWNATDGCCNFHDLPVDDVAYLDAVIDEAVARYPVDPARVYVAGYSNGGFMAHRYACERAEKVAAVVSFAGEPWKDASRCKPRVPVSVLQIHGDADRMVPYEGAAAGHTKESLLRGPVPAAKEAAAMWGRLDACATSATTTEGREEVLWYQACAPKTEVQLWTLHGVTHALPLGHDEMERVWTFLAAHSRK